MSYFTGVVSPAEFPAIQVSPGGPEYDAALAYDFNHGISAGLGSSYGVYTAGDSKANQLGQMKDASVLRWALALAQVRISFNRFRDNLGADGSYLDTDTTLSNANELGVAYPQGILHPIRLAQLSNSCKAIIAEGKVPLGMVQIGTNSLYVKNMTGADAFNAFLTWIDYARKCGTGKFIIETVQPRGQTGATSALLTAAQARQFFIYNKLIRSWATKQRDVILWDTIAILADAGTNAAYFAASGTYSGAGAAGAVMMDGLHLSSYGALKLHSSLAAIFKLIAPPRLVNLSLAGDLWNADNPTGSLLGVSTFTATTGGTNSATGGTVTGTPATGWTTQGTLSGIAVTISTQTSHLWNILLGRTDLIVQRFAFSGTASADGYIQLQNTNQWPVAAAAGNIPAQASVVGTVGFELNVAFNALAGIQIVTQAVDLTSPTYSAGGTGTTDGNSRTLPQLDGCYTFNMSDVPVSANDTTRTRIKPYTQVGWRNGSTVSGSIDILNMRLNQTT